MRRVACSTAVWYLRCGSGRFHARNLRRIIEVCYLRNAKSLPLCGLLIAMSTFLFACGYAGTPPGYHPPPSGNAPTITQQPASVTVTAGQSATFSVVATGTAPLTYQWFMNSARRQDTNSNTFPIAAATAGQTGAQIYVTVTDAAGSATSATVTLTVDAAATTADDHAAACQRHRDGGTAGDIFGDGDGHRATDLSMVHEWHGEPERIRALSRLRRRLPAQSGAQIYVKVTNAAAAPTSNTVTLTVNPPAPTAPAITQQPANATVTAGQPATFTVTATGTAPLTYQWFLNGSAVGTNSNTYSISQTTLAQTGAQIYVTVTNAVNTATSQTVTLTVNAVQTSTVNVLTYHNDVARTGQNLNESTLTTANVNSANFGLVGNLSVDGGVDAEPLYVSNLSLVGGVHNVVYVVTENDSVYAFDADTFAQLWHVSVLGANETASDNRGCGQVSPIIGITSTPVIDLSAGTHGEIFLVAMSLDNSGNYHQRLHALDLDYRRGNQRKPDDDTGDFPEDEWHDDIRSQTI